MNFNYEFIFNAYNELLASQSIFVIITGLKVVGVCVVTIVWYGKYLDYIGDKENKTSPLSPKDLITGFLFIIAISVYDQILYALDLLWGAVEAFYKDFQVQPKDIGLQAPDEITEEEAKGWQDTLKDMAYLVIRTLKDPTYPLVYAAKAIAWFVDLMIFAVFVAERFFFMGILRILGGIAIAFSYHPKLQKWFWNWLGAYTAIWLLIIPYFLVNAFTGIIYERAQVILDDTAASSGLLPTPGVYSPLIILIFFLIWLKFKLYKGSREIVNKIFN